MALESILVCGDCISKLVLSPVFPSSPGKRCMGLVDLDRSWATETHGYSVRVMTMEPESCSPKNNMLVGVPAVALQPQQGT